MLFYELTILIFFLREFYMLRAISVAFLLLATHAYAAEKDKQAVQLSVSAGSVSSQKQLIESKIVNIEYQEMQNADRVELLTQLEAIDSGVATGNTILVYQENINTILKKAFADSKLICTNEMPTGSKRAVRTCSTIAAKERQQQNVQNTRNTGNGPAASSGIQ